MIFLFTKKKMWCSRSYTKNNMLLTTIFVILLTSPLLTEASIGLGLRGALHGIHRALKGGKLGDSKSIPHITVYYPTGVVKDYVFSAVRPFLWTYVCHYCSYMPDRCIGDMALCAINLKRVSMILTNYGRVYSQKWLIRPHWSLGYFWSD